MLRLWVQRGQRLIVFYLILNNLIQFCLIPLHLGPFRLEPGLGETRTGIRRKKNKQKCKPTMLLLRFLTVQSVIKFLPSNFISVVVIAGIAGSDAFPSLSYQRICFIFVSVCLSHWRKVKMLYFLSVKRLFLLRHSWQKQHWLPYMLHCNNWIVSRTLGTVLSIDIELLGNLKCVQKLIINLTKLYVVKRRYHFTVQFN